jgi:hypothetical protein
MIDDAELLKSVQVEVAVGVGGYEQVVQALEEQWETDEGIAELVDGAFARHLAEQEEWPEVTDCDRLTAAFRDLDVAGITAREHFSCCQRCGVDEINEQGVDRGYVFYHFQDVRSAAAECGGVCLSYTPEQKIGEEIAATLRRHGLEVDWDGSTETRIEVRMTWQRRRHGRLAAHPSRAEGPAAELRAIYDDGPMEPMTLQGCLDELMRMRPIDGNFMVFQAPSGVSFQVMWNEGPTLWGEWPDPSVKGSRGRHLSLPEAREMITILAREGRSGADDLGGTEFTPW